MDVSTLMSKWRYLRMVFADLDGVVKRHGTSMLAACLEFIHGKQPESLPFDCERIWEDGLLALVALVSR